MMKLLLGRAVPTLFSHGAASASVERRYPLRIAETETERDAIARFWYRVQIEEQNRAIDFADHQNRRIWTHEDEAPETVHAYIADGEAILGCVRMQPYAPDRIPPQVARYFSTDRLPGLEALGVCVASRLVVERGVRGSLVAATLITQSACFAITALGSEVLLADCAPGLVPHWAKLGLRPYGARLICTYHGLTVPVVGFCNHLDRLRALGSPLYPAFLRLQRQGALPDTDHSAFEPIIQRDRTICQDRARIRRALAALAAEPDGFLEGLSDALIARMADSGLIVRVEAGQQLTHEGVVDRDIYLVLEGQLSVHRARRPLAQLSRGQLFGEISLLSRDGRRTAQVEAQTPCQLFVLRSGFFRKLLRDRPRDAMQLHQRLEQLLTDRLMAAYAAPARTPRSQTA